LRTSMSLALAGAGVEPGRMLRRFGSSVSMKTCSAGKTKESDILEVGTESARPK
jgi:hypothetical protein